MASFTANGRPHSGPTSEPFAALASTAAASSKTCSNHASIVQSAFKTQLYPTNPFWFDIKLGNRLKNVLRIYLADIVCDPWVVAGVPAALVPVVESSDILDGSDVS